jgi:signal transduction histidine kinase
MIQENGGYGLGLSIAKRIVEAHRGTIGAENNGRRVASFVVTLPKSG